ncbi:uncharacterized protein LOC131645090 [Vicia villosa]|uniref:uncharacterized protein LOC131645090 n=1 Tax=Vicia villosa TaxID=3911 RepID=UPI00273B81ED|nr:uncharacterized protein LOC131645090 [Vicia villosa]
MDDDQKKLFKNHHKCRTVLLNAISHAEYEKISNRETTYDIYESLKMTHEGNAQVKETKALALIQKYEAFKMEDDEDIEKMFSRFQTLTAGLRVLDKGYTKADHVKKIIRSLPRRWGPMVTAFKIAKNLNEVSLEELISALRSHEIELDANEPQKKGKSIALKSNIKKCTNAFQAREEDPEESESEEEDELSMISRRVNQVWKSKQRKFRGFRSSKRFERGESSDDRRFDKKKVMCYECNEPGQYKNECPKLQKENPKKKFHKKKSLMATWDESEDESDSEDEQANFALMATEDDGSESTSESDSEEVFSELSRKELVSSLAELLELKAHLSIKYKKLKKQFEFETEKLELENSELKEKVLNLSKNSGSPSETEKAIPSMNHIRKEYDLSFRKFLYRSIGRSQLASMIYAVSGNNRVDIGYEGEIPYKLESVANMKISYKPLYNQFKFGHSHDIRLTSHAQSFHLTHTKKHVTQSKKYHGTQNKKYHTVPPVKYFAKPKFNQNLRRTNKKGPKKMWVPKEKIISVADILGGKEDRKQNVMVPGLWVLATHDGKKVYIPRPGA